MDNLLPLREKQDWKQIFDFSSNPQKLSPIIPSGNLGVRIAFGKDIRHILEEQRRVSNSPKAQYEYGDDTSQGYYQSLRQTTNGDTIVNPSFFIDQDGISTITAQIGRYQTYHAVNGLRNGFGGRQGDIPISSEYKVLSAGVVMYHKKTDTFYLFKRPENSQEAPGEVDILGGCLNTNDGAEGGSIYPERFVTSRMQKKAGLSIDPDSLQCLGIQEFGKRGFYNIVYFYELSDEDISSLSGKGSLSPISQKEAEIAKNQDGPGGAGLTLAMKYINRVNHGESVHLEA